MRYLLIIIILLQFTLESAERAVWSGFKYSGRKLDDETIKAINVSFRDELVNSGYFQIIDRDFLDNKLLEKLDNNQNYSPKDINLLLRQAANTDNLISGELTALPDRFSFSVSYSNTTTGGLIASVADEYAVNVGFLPFHVRQLAKDLVDKIKNQVPTSFNRKLLKNNRQKIEFNGSAFYMDAYEVTNFFFQAFVDATSYQTDAEKKGYGWLFRDNQWQKVKGVNWRHPAGSATLSNGMEDLPVVHISRNDALAFCKWAEKRLPTVKEWETAAGGRSKTKFAYGNRFDDLKGNFNSGETGWISKSGAFGAENNNLYDLSGNVSEWTADSVKVKGQTFYYIKGGNWLSSPTETETTHLNYQPADSYFPYLGFRCVSDE